MLRMCCSTGASLAMFSLTWNWDRLLVWKQSQIWSGKNIARLTTKNLLSKFWLCVTKICLSFENFQLCRSYPKIQQTKMLVTCQRFSDWFLFGQVWPYSSNQKNIMKVGSKSLLLTCSSNKLWDYLYYIFLIRSDC